MNDNKSKYNVNYKSCLSSTIQIKSLQKLSGKIRYVVYTVGVSLSSWRISKFTMRILLNLVGIKYMQDGIQCPIVLYEGAFYFAFLIYVQTINCTSCNVWSFFCFFVFFVKIIHWLEHSKNLVNKFMLKYLVYYNSYFKMAKYIRKFWKTPIWKILIFYN